METEMLLRVVAVVIAGAILLSNFDYSNLWQYLKSFVPKKNVIVIPKNSKNVSFLKIVESWHVLRNECEAHGLKDAVNKIDEVFPLLNVEE